MPYDSRVYRILIASPSDVEEEREIAVRVIQEWNDLYSYSRKVALLPLRWETHTAPEYGTRPQEVINRAIVDQCDLVVGIFWARLGSPTGEADSGTLEEIERAGHAGKPIMLYFSKRGMDPDSLDLMQVNRLREFKEKTYPKSLTESFKTPIEFRDKFSKQLELKVRDLQREEHTGPPPLEFSFLSVDTGELVGARMERSVALPVVEDLAERLNSVEESQKLTLQNTVDLKVKEAVAVPVLLALRNTSSSGLRDLYVEVAIKASNEPAEITESFGRGRTYSNWVFETGVFERSAIEEKVSQRCAQFEERGLKRDISSWRLSFQCGRLQPQRTRLVKPTIFAVVKESTTFIFAATLFTDGFPKPIDLQTTLDVSVNPTSTTLDQLIPKLESLLSSMGTKTEKIWLTHK
jgi:nucleoside 2-deoxyribosyltransferase